MSRLDDEIEVTERDYVMARLAAARTAAQSSIEAIDEALALFVDPEEDARGRQRKELIDAALEAAGCVARALEDAENVLPDVDYEECEPWDSDEEEESEGDDEEEDEPEIPRATARKRKRA